MRYIKFVGMTPVNTTAVTEVPEFTPWTQAKWNAWLKKSQEHHDCLVTFEQAGKREERNAYIDKKTSHWGKLKPWLQALSHGKCWFSEVRDLYSHYDVEHFRPKKETKDIKGKVRDGYWWLAFDYTNYRLCGGVGNKKKGGFFPLNDESLVSEYTNQCEDSETPYLLDPTNLYDVLLIAFDEEGKVIPTPTEDIIQWEVQRVEETIKRLKLNEHEVLTEGRRKVWQDVSREIEGYLTAKSKTTKGNNPAVRQKIFTHLENIKEMTCTTKELSSVARWCISFRNDRFLNRLLG
jgi:uncharacterized protein (TIGR02646 family)